jgi:steroid delta-isomerase-like uncharacterized protein
MSMTHDLADTNLALVRAGFEDFNAGDLDGCVARARTDLVMHLAGVPEPLRGRETWREGAAMIRRAFPDLHADIQDIFASGDRVAVRLRFRGTHEGEYLGHPPTGRSIEYVSHEFYRVAGGLIAEEWICSDTATLFGQIG